MWFDMRRTLYPALLLVCGLTAVAGTSHAVVVEGRSTTDVLWFSDIEDASKHTSIAESLRVSLSRIDSAEKFSLKGYGKVDYDSKNTEKLTGRLYYLYADYKGFMDKADIRLGRQFVNMSAGSTLMDGIQADINKLGPVGVAVMAGRDVLFSEDRELASYQYSGGVAAYLSGFKRTDLDVSYYRVFGFGDSSRFADRMILRDMIGGSFKHYLIDMISIYGNGRYDLTSKALSEALAGLKYFPSLDFMLSLEHYESYPSFDANSIYSVFAVNRYKENLIRAEHTIAAWFDISLGYNAEEFGEGGRAQLYEVGIRFRPTPFSAVSLYHDKRWGYPGNLDGYKLSAEYGSPGSWKAAAGVDYDTYVRDDMTGRESARRYWAAGKYHFTKHMAASLRAENNVNLNYTKDTQGRASFDVDF